MTRDMVSTAQALREVKQAYRRFLTLWLFDSMSERRTPSGKGRQAERQIADFHNHDWSMLYRGNILDD